MNQACLSREEFDKIKDLLEEVAYAPTMADGKNSSKKLNFYIGSIGRHIASYPRGVIGEAAEYASTASGKVQDKAHWLDAMEEKLYVLESFVERTNSNA